MKKFLSKIMFAAVAVLSVSGFTSCNNDDDQRIPTPASVQKETTNKVTVYSAYVNDDALNLYDISLTLHSGDKSKVVKLDKSMGTPVNIEYQRMNKPSVNLPGYRFDFDNVDGIKNIDYVEANSTLKPEAEGIVNAMDPEKEYYYAASCAFGYLEFQANGHYGFEGVAIKQALGYHRENLLRDKDGKKIYETFDDLFKIRLSKKRPGM